MTPSVAAARAECSSDPAELSDLLTVLRRRRHPGAASTLAEAGGRLLRARTFALARRSTVPRGVARHA
jgi:hypothetical protein